MGSNGRYYYLDNIPEALAKLQVWLELGKFLERSREVQAQEVVHGRSLEGVKLAGILIIDIRMFKNGESTRRRFTKDHIKSILLLFYETNTFRSRKN